MRFLFTILACLICLGVSAQQAAQYSLYMMNEMNWNPAYAGMENSFVFTGGIRNQWDGFSEIRASSEMLISRPSPSGQFISAHLPLYFLQGGIGVQLENDELGPEQNLTATLSYNYQLPVGAGVLSIGVGGGIIQKGLDGTKLRTPQGVYTDGSAINHQDPILPSINQTASVTVFRAGIYYKSERFEAGFAATNLRAPSIVLGDLSIALSRNLYFNAGYNLDIGQDLTFHPSLLVKSDMTQIQTDVSGLFYFKEKIMLGGSFRGYDSNSIDATSIMGGFKISENIMLSYAYDITLSDLKLLNNGSHEVLINYTLNIGGGRLPDIIYNPRKL